MIVQIVDLLTNIFVWIIGVTGYTGIFFLMFVESCGIPMPSEITMPFSGFLVVTGQLNFWLVVIIGALGNLAGSYFAYYIAFKGGRPLIEKYGKFIFISKHDINKADEWFVRHGEVTVFIGRLLPVIRTYISFPAGAAKMNTKKFLTYTFLGSLPWSFALTYLGVKLQKNWVLIESKMHNLDVAIIIFLMFIITIYVWRHLKNRKEYNA